MSRKRSRFDCGTPRLHELHCTRMVEVDASASLRGDMMMMDGTVLTAAEGAQDTRAREEGGKSREIRIRESEMERIGTSAREQSQSPKIENRANIPHPFGGGNGSVVLLNATGEDPSALGASTQRPSVAT